VCLPAYREHMLEPAQASRGVPLCAVTYSLLDIHIALPILTRARIVPIVWILKSSATRGGRTKCIRLCSMQSGVRGTPHPYLPFGHRGAMRTGAFA